MIRPHPSHLIEARPDLGHAHCSRCLVKVYDDGIAEECGREVIERETAALKQFADFGGGSLFDRICFHRMAAAIERCHCKTHLIRYSVGHHTHDVVTLLIQCWKHAHEGALPRAELLVAAHVHDHPELVVGDIPSPIKDLLGGKLDDVEESVERWLGCHPELTEEEAQYLAAADRFELWLWCYEEMSRGNRDVGDWAESYYQAWQAKPLPYPFMELIDEVRAVGGVPHVSRDILNTAGGLTR